MIGFGSLGPGGAHNDTHHHHAECPAVADDVAADDKLYTTHS